VFEGDLLSRRAFLKGGTLFLAGSMLPKALASWEPSTVIKLGLMTDIHYADMNQRGTRVFRDSLPKMRQVIDSLLQNQADILVELGDLIDTPSRATKDTDLQTLQTINAEFARFGHRRHYVLGNHCLWKLSKREFFAALNRPPISHYSFNKKGWHFVVLDACFRGDGARYDSGNFVWTDCDIPRYQAEWLKCDLKANNLPTVVFVHQRVDVDPPNPYGI
jgi:alkaline phosphatase